METIEQQCLSLNWLMFQESEGLGPLSKKIKIKVIFCRLDGKLSCLEKGHWTQSPKFGPSALGTRPSLYGVKKKFTKIIFISLKECEKKPSMTKNSKKSVTFLC